MAENFPNLIKDINPQIQEVQCNTNKTILRYVLVTLWNIKGTAEHPKGSQK